MSEQYTWPATMGETSPIEMPIIASSSSAMPSGTRPAYISIRPCALSPWASRSASLNLRPYSVISVASLDAGSNSPA